MTEKIVVQINREAANRELEATATRQEKRRKKFEDESYWPLIIRGPFGALIYGMFVYPRVFFNHVIMDSPLYPLTIYEETIVRTTKWSMNAPLKTLRKSGSFLESLFKIFRCSEPFRETKIEEIEGYWLGPETYKQKESEATILYLHGGGYVALSSLFAIRPLCYLLRHLRKRHNKHIRVLAIDYTLAPEGPFPTGLNCVERTYRWLVKSGIAGSKNVFLCGDSAGGGLVLALLQKLYPVTAEPSDDIPLPLGVILISPWVELSCDSLSYFTNAEFDWISGHLTQLAAESYIFGKGGNPACKRNQIQPPPPKIDKDVIMEWLEKVESNFDLIDVEGVENRFSISELNKRLSSHSLNDSKRHSGVKARKRGSGGAKRRSRVRDDITEKIIVQTHDSEEKRKIKNESNTIYITEENPYRDPLISPLHIPHHILAKFPPLFISYGGKEIFRDDIEMFTRKCIESKKAYTSFDNNDDDKTDNSLDGQHPDVIVEMNEDMIHIYPFVIDAFGKHSKKALDRIVPFIANRIPIPNAPLRIQQKISSRISRSTYSPAASAVKLSTPPLSIYSNMNRGSLSNSRISLISNEIPNSRKTLYISPKISVTS